MSYFSQFVGTQVPIGGVIQAPSGLYQINPTIAGSEYLATGNIKPYTSTYSALATSFPVATVQTATTTSTWGNATALYGGQSGQGSRLEKGGSYYYQFMFWAAGSASATAYRYGASLTTSVLGSGAAGSNASTGQDSLTFNGNAIYSWGTTIYSGNSTVGSGALQTRYTETVSTSNFLAASGTTAIAVRGNTEQFATATAGFVKTSTNGTTWTNQTISVSGGAATETCVRVTWSTIGNCFIFVGSAGSIYTSPDGYTLTKRTTPSGMPATVTAYQGNNSLCANSSTATLISLGGLTGLGAGPYVLKTTNGTTFTVIDLSTSSGLFSAFSGQPPNGNFPPVPQIAWDTTTSKLVIACCSTYYYTGGQILAIAYSTNDGASWQIDSVKALSTGANGFFGMNSTSDGNFAMGIGSSDGNDSKYCTPAFLNNKIGTGVPDYVGYSTAATSGSNTDYIRIA